jgi:transcriptional regulator with XRE-family HTH domain
MRETSFRKNLSRSIKRVRLERGFTQRDLAQVAGITEKYLSRIELGLVTPSALVVFRLCRELGIDFGALVSSDVRPKSPNHLAIARLLHKRPENDVDRARRVLVEMFR